MNKLAVDLNTNTNNNLGRIKKCDSTELEIILKNGQDYSKCSFRLLGIKADGKRVEQLDNYKLLENKLTFNLNREFTTCEGIVKLELNVFKENEEITTQTFYFLVSNTLNSEIITSSEDIKTLRDLEHYILVANNALQDTNKTINALQDTSNKIIPVENKRIENEAARKQDEKFRTAAEKDRIAAEKVRSKSEDDRNNTEEERQLNENTRQSNELKRKTAENLRVKREDAREAAEVLRQDLFEENEGIRNESENTRIKNENKRILSENIRIENEDNRILQEEDRQKKEDIRIKNEDLRAAAEKIREQQETNREKHYNDFNNAESDRVKAEQIREQKETERIEAESKRNELYNEAEKKRDLSFEEAERNRTRIYNVAEDERTENEKNRIIAESKRNSKEDIRINSEKLRVAAESKREQQEVNRNNTFEESQRNREELYNEAEKIREQAESARVEAEKIRGQQESERIEAEKIREEKIEQFGLQVNKNKNDIADNSKDIERAFETINDNSFIPFTGENISVEHSKVGFTKDMKVEGMTYQNLLIDRVALANDINVFNHNYNKISLKQCDNYIEVTSINESNDYTLLGYDVHLTQEPNLFKFNTKYLIMADIEILENPTNENFCVGGFLNNIKNKKINSGRGIVAKVMETGSDFNGNNGWINIGSDSEASKGTKFRYYGGIALELSPDELSNKSIDELINKYWFGKFEGIKSVGEKENKISVLSTGKNLFNKSDLISGYISNGIDNDWGGYFKTNNFIKITKGTKYCITKAFKNGTYLLNNTLTIACYDSNKNFLRNENISNSLIAQSGTLPEDCSFIRIAGGLGEFKIEEINIMLEEGIEQSVYEPYKINKKEILFPFSDGLKGLPNGAKDDIIMKEDGLYVRQNIRKSVINDLNNWFVSETNGIYSKFRIENFQNMDWGNIQSLLCDKFIVLTDSSGKQKDCEYISSVNHELYSIILQIKTSKLETNNLTGFKKWIKENPITIYYSLKTPIEHKITDLNSINLETFKDITYVSSKNEIQPNLSFKAPVDIPKTISSLRNANTMLIAQNVGLENKNKQLEKVNNKQTEKINQLDEATTALISSALM